MVLNPKTLLEQFCRTIIEPSKNFLFESHPQMPSIPRVSGSEVLPRCVA